MNADFTLSIGNTGTKFIVTDASTVGYGGESIASRNIEIEDYTGVITTVDFPLITGVGDQVVYDLLTPKSVKIKIVVVPITPAEGSIYNKEYSYITLSPFDSYLQSLEDNIIYNIDPKSVLSSSTSLLRAFEWSKSLYDFGLVYTSAGEIASAQKCIDGLIELSKSR